MAFNIQESIFEVSNNQMVRLLWQPYAAADQN